MMTGKHCTISSTPPKGRGSGHFRRDLSRPSTTPSPRDRRAAVGQCRDHQLVLEIFLHDGLAHRLDGAAESLIRAVERLQGNLAISVPTLSRSRRSGVRPDAPRWRLSSTATRRIGASCSTACRGPVSRRFLPVDGAFYLYADASRFCDDSFDFAKRMLEENARGDHPRHRFRSAAREALIQLLLCGLGRRNA